MFENYFQAIRYLESVNKISQPVKANRSYNLPRIGYLLKQVGNPHLKIQYIHVGGTTGKGSVANLIQIGLLKLDPKAGLYTSPHLSTTIERIKVGKKFISPGDFADLMEQLKPAIDKTYISSGFGRPSYFEILLALAFLYFKKMKCRYVVLEAGIGGKLDPTNIIPSPVAAIINLVDYDHREILGNTLQSIAREKSGIIKPKTQFYTIDLNKSKVLKIFKNACLKTKAGYNLIAVKNLKNYQSINQKIAQTVLQKIYDKTKLEPLLPKQIKMAGRFEIIQQKPIVILDGAHNRSKVNSLLKDLENLTYRRLFIIIALTKERSPKPILGRLIKEADRVYLTRYPFGKACWGPIELAKSLKLKRNYQINLDPFQALKHALRLAKPQDLILITGSFFLAGELRKQWISENEILKLRELKIKK